MLNVFLLQEQAVDTEGFGNCLFDEEEFFFFFNRVISYVMIFFDLFEYRWMGVGSRDQRQSKFRGI